MSSSVPSTSAQPFTSTFSFTAPFPVSQSSSSQSQSGKQRRVSLALPSSPRVFPAWSFRDDTGVGVHSADAEGEDEVKKGKMRKIAADGDGAQPPAHLSDRPEKKPRKKWTMEETQMLVAGCNKVRGWPCGAVEVGCSYARRGDSGVSGTGSLSSTTPTSGSMGGPRWT